MRAHEFITEESYTDNALVEYLESRGYTPLGAGRDQSAWLEPGTGLVLKIFGTGYGDYKRGDQRYTRAQQSFITFRNLCRAYPDNPFLPNIISVQRRLFKNRYYLWIKMERLFPFVGSGVDEWRFVFNIMGKYRNSNMKFDDFLQEVQYNKQWESAFEQVSMHLGMEGLKQLWDTLGLVIAEARANGYRIDLNTSNIMLSSDGHPVISDPYVVGTPMHKWGDSAGTPVNEDAELPKQHLRIFDIDDTLLHTTAQIGVVKDGRVIRRLSNQQFNDYQLRPGESFDFSEFRDSLKFHNESTPITRMIAKLKHSMRDPRNDVIFLTARADFDDRDLFLLTFENLGIDMSRIHVHRAGNLPGDSAPAYKKAVWVRRYLDTGRYSDVTLYDDSTQNLRVFKSLEQEYPRVQFHAHHVGSSGRTRAVESQLVEMPMVQQGNLGDQLQGPFIPRNLRLINSPAARDKTVQYFRKTPFNFRVFFCHYPANEVLKYTTNGRETRNSLFGGGRSRPLSKEQIIEFCGSRTEDAKTILDNSQNSITMIIWPGKNSQSGPSSIPMTSHIIAHWFGHAMMSRPQLNIANNSLENAIKNIYNVRYGLNSARTSLANALGTTRAGRQGRLTVHQELSHEALAQYINTGQVTLRPLPETITDGDKMYHANIDATQRQEWSQQFAQQMTQQFEQYFTSMTGTIWIMSE